MDTGECRCHTGAASQLQTNLRVKPLRDSQRSAIELGCLVSEGAVCVVVRAAFKLQADAGQRSALSAGSAALSGSGGHSH